VRQYLVDGYAAERENESEMGLHDRVLRILAAADAVYPPEIRLWKLRSRNYR
jgi:hypothetical protein